MSGSHRVTESRSKVTLGNIFVLVMVCVIVGIVLSQVNWHGSRKAVSPKPIHISTVVPTVSTSSNSPAPTVSKPAEKKTPVRTTAPAKPILVYVVKPGDNLTAIAIWFHAHGYMPLYEWNKQVIGSDPNLIYPGQVLIVSPGSSALKVVNP